MQSDRMPDIVIDIGVCTRFTINLSGVDFTGIEKIIFTVKNDTDTDSPVIIEREFTESGSHSIIIAPEESVRLKNGAEYDLNKLLVDGTRHKMTNNGSIVLRRGVGGCLG